MRRLPPPLVALAAGLAQRALTGATPAPSPPRAATTAILSVASVALAGAAAAQFRRSGTTIDPLRPETTSAVVASGPFTLTRNPMYVGMAGLLVAHACWRGSWLSLAPAAGFVAFIDRVQISAEESALREKFGPEYEVYLTAAPRWLDHRSLHRLPWLNAG